MRSKFLFTTALLFVASLTTWGQTFHMETYGIAPGTAGLPEKIAAAMDRIQDEAAGSDSIVLKFQPGRYDFHSTEALARSYYISNHDQRDHDLVAIEIKDWDSLTMDWGGAELVFHGEIIPLAVTGSRNCTLCNFSIDFENPQIAQVRIVENRGDSGILFKPEPWVKYHISRDSLFEITGEGWTLVPSTGIAFEPATGHILWNTGDIFYSTKGVRKTADGLLAPSWKDDRLTPGTFVAMRSWNRPAPGIFLYDNTETTLRDIQVHYAYGMGLVAQLCDGISLERFSVCRKGEHDPRYFTTQADATHFSQCKGLITSTEGLYEGMMDDAINVHGIYLKVMEQTDDSTLRARFMHSQAWGFKWGEAGDSVRLVDADVMEYTGETMRIESIVPLGGKDEGMKEFLITLDRPADIDPDTMNMGIENLTWTPEVVFADNTVRSNRARGALFSTSRRTIVERNVFDHTSGTAILLCGDCNGWYESGPCRDVLIRDNTFINALTSMYQFTSAIISIYPEIPDLERQKGYFHGGRKGAVTITGNTFDTFDFPILYAKSIDGLIFKDNIILRNDSYMPFHWNTDMFLLERCDNIEISE